MLAHTLFAWQAPCETLPAGAVLMQHGAPLSSVLRLDEGSARLQRIGSDGVVHHLGLRQGPCWLNACCAVLGQPPLLDAVAHTPVRVQRMPLPAFHAQVQALPLHAQSLLHDLALAQREQMELTVSRLFKHAEARCAEWLLRHAEPTPDAPAGALAVRLSTRKRTIAAQLGIAPETFSRILRQLRERSLISGSGRVLNLLDPGGLRALAGL